MKKINKNHILYLLASMFFMGLAATDIYISSLPEMVRHFESSPNVINMTISVFTVGGAIFVLFADMLSSRFGRKPIIIFSVLIYTVSSFLISISSSIWLIIVLRFFQSGVALVYIVSRQVLKDILDEREQVRANGIILAGLVISPAVSPVIGAYLSHHFGWRSCFVFTGVLGIILVSFAFKVLPETNHHKLKKLPHIWQYTVSHIRLMGNRFFLCITAIYVCGTGAFYAFIGISSYLYINHLGVTPIYYSYIYMLMAVAYLAGNQYMMHMNRHEASYNKLIGQGVIVTLLGAIIILLAKSFAALLLIVIFVTIGSMLMRAANALTNPTTQVLTMNYFKEEGGRALGLAMSVNSAMMGVGVTLVTLFHNDPLEGLIIISMIFSFIGIAAFYMIRKDIAAIVLKRNH